MISLGWRWGLLEEPLARLGPTLKRTVGEQAVCAHSSPLPTARRRSTCFHPRALHMLFLQPGARVSPFPHEVRSARLSSLQPYLFSIAVPTLIIQSFHLSSNQQGSCRQGLLPPVICGRQCSIKQPRTHRPWRQDFLGSSSGFVDCQPCGVCTKESALYASGTFPHLYSKWTSRVVQWLNPHFN